MTVANMIKSIMIVVTVGYSCCLQCLLFLSLNWLVTCILFNIHLMWLCGSVCTPQIDFHRSIGNYLENFANNSSNFLSATSFNRNEIAMRHNAVFLLFFSSSFVYLQLRSGKKVYAAMRFNFTTMFTTIRVFDRKYLYFFLLLK